VESRAKLAGHAVHPMLIVLPLGLLATAVILTAWAGGELVERLGVGVDEGANLDAPSSLSGPARAARPHQITES
jgi:uncharacterized membrane protein